MNEAELFKTFEVSTKKRKSFLADKVEIDEEFFRSLKKYLYESTIFRGSPNKILKILVFESGRNAVQLKPFNEALGLAPSLQRLKSLGYSIQLRRINNDEMRSHKLFPKLEDLFKCVREFDIHMFLSHIHQAIDMRTKTFKEWNIPKILYHFDLLELHNGFPFGEKLKCPVFTQDKFEQISLVPELFLPSHRVNMNTFTGLLDSATQNFLDTTSGNEYDGEGHMVKSGFTTNQKYSTAKSNKKVVGKLQTFVNKGYRGIIPYMFIQPTLKNRMEYKVVCFNGIAIYIASFDENKGKERKAFSNTQDIMKFAEKAIALLKKRCLSFLCDGLIRVDIMYLVAQQKMFVNEFESLEANYYSTDILQQNKIENLLRVYWIKVIDECISRYEALTV